MNRIAHTLGAPIRKKQKMSQCSEQNIKCIEEVEWSRVTYGDVSKKPCEFDHSVPSISMMNCHIVNAGLCNTVHCIAVYRIRTE